jgi:large subunit ribosomal protein L9
MKVIFIQDVPNVAKIGELKEVADGYSRNYLIPHKLALPATPETMRQMETQRKAFARSQADEIARDRETAGKLDGKEFIIKARAGAEGKLFGSITSADIANELEKTAGTAIDKRKIELEAPIRQTGNYDVIVRFAKDITPKVKITVEGQE